MDIRLLTKIDIKKEYGIPVERTRRWEKAGLLTKYRWEGFILPRFSHLEIEKLLELFKKHKFYDDVKKLLNDN
jgi:hypothetical protein